MESRRVDPADRSGFSSNNNINSSSTSTDESGKGNGDIANHASQILVHETGSPSDVAEFMNDRESRRELSSVKVTMPHFLYRQRKCGCQVTARTGVGSATIALGPCSFFGEQGLLGNRKGMLP